jgi:hypothetical protein
VCAECGGGLQNIADKTVLNLNYLAHRFVELSVENFDCRASVSKET